MDLHAGRRNTALRRLTSLTHYTRLQVSLGRARVLKESHLR